MLRGLFLLVAGSPTYLNEWGTPRAVVELSSHIAEVRAVATVGAPADAGHVLKNFGTSLEEIEKSGEAEVDLAGRKFRVTKQFVEDVRAQRISVDVSHAKSHAKDCEECTESERSSGGRIDRFERIISIDGEVPEDLRGKIAEIAGKCPVHRTLEAVAKIKTVVKLENQPTTR